MDTTPTHVRFPCTNGEYLTGLVMRTYTNNGIGGYVVSANGGQEFFVPYGLVCYNL